MTLWQAIARLWGSFDPGRDPDIVRMRQRADDKTHEAEDIRAKGDRLQRALDQGDHGNLFLEIVDTGGLRQEGER